MNRCIVLLTSLSLTLVGLALTNAAPAAAQAIVSATRYTFPLDGVEANACTGEDIAVEGDIMLMERVVEDGKGGFLLQYAANATGVSATGLDSGLRYRVVGGERLVIRASAPFPYVETGPVMIRYVATEGESSLVIEAAHHIIVDANGNTRVDVLDWDIRCE